MPESMKWIASMVQTLLLSQAGGKAYGLYQLVQLGLPVPEFLVVKADAFSAFCQQGQIPETLPDELDAELNVLWNSFSGSTLAVRSSAIDEDGSLASFAGQMDTVLNIADRQALSQAVLTCWRSIHGERVVAYRQHRQHVKTDALAMAVVIQRMIHPDASGVLFTNNPTSGRGDEVLVSAVYGLGEGLVSGKLDADTFILNQQGELLSQTIARKSERYAGQPEGGIGLEAVPSDRVEQPALTPEMLKTLCDYALAAEKQIGYPLDIEFCVSDGQPYFLQARPITGFHYKATAADGHRQVWDNSNINESYPGITLPLTFSFIRKAYYCVYWQFLEVLGLGQAEIRANEIMLQNMLGLIQGRVYYNLLNWYQLVALMPGFQFNKGFMEAMMGLETPDDLDEKPLTWFEQYCVQLPRLVRVGTNMLCLQVTINQAIKAFHANFNQVYAQLSAITFETLTPLECLEQYARMEREILWRWKAPIINDFSAMIFYGLLKKLTQAWQVDSDGSLQNALISGQGDIESTEVSRRLLDIARQVESDPEFRQTFLQSSPHQAYNLLSQHPRFGPALATYLSTYGDRCTAELKLESIPMKDNPAFCVVLIQNYLNSGVFSKPEAPSIRHDAEGQLKDKLGGIVSLRYWIYRAVLHYARMAIRNRENQRLARTRAFGLVRRIFRLIGSWMARHKLLDHKDDIFYLEVDEIRHFFQGTGTILNLQSLVNSRKRDYETFHQLQPLPDHLVTFGIPNLGNPYYPEVNEARTDSILTGLGACPGIVEAEAIVMLSPDTSTALNGQILVTRQTDPGWVVLFPSIRGLVVERGSMLSHSAIVAREMGIPAVVGVKGAVESIQSGNRLRIDGAKGTVEIIR